jgi:hypothetical protein
MYLSAGIAENSFDVDMKEVRGRRRGAGQRNGNLVAGRLCEMRV